MDDDQQAEPPPADGAARKTRAKKSRPRVSPADFDDRHRSFAMERDYLRTLVGPEFRPVLGMVVITLTTGTIFYRLVENWSLLNAFYFSVVTLATIGFGDFAPATRIGKIFTIFYVFVGVGTLGLFLSTVARYSARKSLHEHDIAVERALLDDDEGD